MSAVQQDLFEARRLRNDGISRVLTRDEQWTALYKSVIAKWFAQQPTGHLFTGETLRLVAKHCGMINPHHHNAWGGAASSVICAWIKAGAIEVHGLKNATAPKSHARIYREYIKL
jgi:hypothetical protein